MWNENAIAISKYALTLLKFSSIYYSNGNNE